MITISENYLLTALTGQKKMAPHPHIEWNPEYNHKSGYQIYTKMYLPQSLRNTFRNNANWSLSTFLLYLSWKYKKKALFVAHRCFLPPKERNKLKVIFKSTICPIQQMPCFILVLIHSSPSLLTSYLHIIACTGFLFGSKAYQIREVTWLKLLYVICSHLAGLQGQWFQILEWLQVLQPRVAYTRVWHIQRDQFCQPCTYLKMKHSVGTKWKKCYPY